MMFLWLLDVIRVCLRIILIVSGSLRRFLRLRVIGFGLSVCRLLVCLLMFIIFVRVI